MGRTGSVACRGLSESEFPGRVYCALSAYGSKGFRLFSSIFPFLKTVTGKTCSVKTRALVQMHRHTWSCTHAIGQKHKLTLHPGIRNPSPPPSHLSFHCNCNQWFPSNVIYFHSILTGSAVKEIGTKQPQRTQTKTRKES